MNALILHVNGETIEPLRGALEQSGFVPSVADDIVSACSQVESKQHAVAVVGTGSSADDSADADAEDACRRLRRAGGENLFLLVVVAENDAVEEGPERLHRLLEAGADDYLATPLDETRLRMRLAVARHRLRRSSDIRIGDLVMPPHSLSDCPFLQKMPFGVFRSNVSGRFMEVNDTLVEMLGYADRDELLGVDLASDLYRDPEQRRRIFASLDTDYASVEIDCKRKDGEPMTAMVSGRILRDANGDITQIEAVAHDITRQKETENRLRESEARWRSLFENLPDFVIMVDTEATIQYANHPTPGGTVEDLVGKNGFGSLIPDHQVRCREAFGRALQTGRTQAVEALDVFGVWWACRVVPVIEEDTTRNVMIICTDITETKNAHEALKNEEHTLRQMLDLHERDRRMMAYEIHDGFAQQLTAAKFLLEGSEQIRETAPAEAREQFREAVHAVGNSIIETRRLIGGLRPPVLDELGIVAALDYLVCESRDREPRDRDSQAIEFVHDVRFDRLAPPLETALFRVVQESLNNACRYSHSERIRIEIKQTDDRVHVEVRDWGVGFDPETIQENRFGLQGIRERTRLLDGDVVIESAPGEGTRVAVTLPLVEYHRKGDPFSKVG